MDAVTLFKALGDESRARAVSALADGELCVCQITDLLKLSPSTVSKHMTILLQAGLVSCRKEGRWHYYRLAGREATPAARQVIRLAINVLKQEPVIMADAQAISDVRGAVNGVSDPCCREK